MKIPRRPDTEYMDWAYDFTGDPEATMLLLKHRDALWRAAAALIADVRKRYPGQKLTCKYMRALDRAVNV